MTTTTTLTTVLPPTAELFGICFDAVDLDGAVDRIAHLSRQPGGDLVVTANVDHIMLLDHTPAFRDAYDRASLRVVDGAPLVAVAKLGGRHLPARVTGADLLPAVCERAARDGLKVYVLGGAPEVAEEAARRLREQHPGLNLAIDSPPLGFDKDESASEEALTKVRAFGTDVLFCCLGSPKGEIWAARHLDRIDDAVAISAGAAIDFAAGAKRRAPRWMQRAGLEWLFRLIQEPRRLAHRYLVRDLPFVLKGLREAWRLRRST